MRICYVLLSPTWGMHQYTADLANRQSDEGCEVQCVTTRSALRDRYSPHVTLHTPVANRSSGFSAEGVLGVTHSSRLVRMICDLQPDVVHFTGPYLWNPLLLNMLRKAGIPTVHTLHDLHPHAGTTYGRLLYAWNGWVRHAAGHLLVHARCYREALLAQGMGIGQVTCTPLTHLFVGYATGRALMRADGGGPSAARGSLDVVYEPWALFIGRLEEYKGLHVLVDAARLLDQGVKRLIVAGPGTAAPMRQAPLPGNLELRNRLIGDDEAIDLFRRCGVVVLPYVEASQSALVAAAHFFHKPVIVTRAGALPEYVSDGETGWIVPANEVDALAQALEDALSDPERLARMGGAGRTSYERWRQDEGVALRQMYANVEVGSQVHRTRGIDGTGGAKA